MQVGLVKIAFFDRSRSLRGCLTAENLILLIRHSGPRPRRCADEWIRGVISNFGDSRSLIITCMVQLVAWKSVDDTYISSHAGCAAVEPIATVHVQNCALQVAEKTWQSLRKRRICVRYSCNSWTVWQQQHFDWYRYHAGLSAIAEPLVQA